VTKDEDNKKRTDAVIDQAQGSRDELLTAITRLEWYANELSRAADRRRPPDQEGGPRDQ
jgi:hypothetical protein